MHDFSLGLVIFVFLAGGWSATVPVKERVVALSGQAHWYMYTCRILSPAWRVLAEASSNTGLGEGRGGPGGLAT